MNMSNPYTGWAPNYLYIDYSAQFLLYSIWFTSHYFICFIALLEEPVTSDVHCHNYTVANVHMTIQALNLEGGETLH